jgi:NMD protein affecting ribosome stability and mRNA decay
MERRRDVERTPGKLPEPTACPQCGAVFHKGRWTWDEMPAGARERLCPACRRINANTPDGSLVLRGGYLRAHRQDILNLARNEEAQEKAEHPLSRIMTIKEEDDTLELSTTDVHLVRRIGEALHKAHQGDFSIQYSKGEQFARAVWTREE